jgi:hypothetical protein
MESMVTFSSLLQIGILPEFQDWQASAGRAVDFWSFRRSFT